MRHAGDTAACEQQAQLRDSQPPAAPAGEHERAVAEHRDDIPIRRGRTTWRKLSSASIDGRLCLGLRFQLRVMFR